MDGAGSAAGSFSLLAFKRGDDQNDLHRRRMPLKRLHETVAWAISHGKDTLLIELLDEPPSDPRCANHVSCADPACPGGC